MIHLAKTLDGTGFYGSLLHFVIAAFSFGCAFLIFIYLWRKGRLDMDDEPARRMLEDEPENNTIKKKEKADEPRK